MDSWVQCRSFADERLCSVHVAFWIRAASRTNADFADRTPRPSRSPREKAQAMTIPSAAELFRDLAEELRNNSPLKVLNREDLGDTIESVLTRPEEKEAAKPYNAPPAAGYDSEDWPSQPHSGAGWEPSEDMLDKAYASFMCRSEDTRTALTYALKAVLPSALARERKEAAADHRADCQLRMAPFGLCTCDFDERASRMNPSQGEGRMIRTCCLCPRKIEKCDGFCLVRDVLVADARGNEPTWIRELCWECVERVPRDQLDVELAASRPVLDAPAEGGER